MSRRGRFVDRIGLAGRSGLVLCACVTLWFRPASLEAQRPPQSNPLFPPQYFGGLETPDRGDWQKPDEIMDALKIADGARVADIAAGSGWFTIRLARRVGPNGLVYAEDIQRQMLEVIRRRV